MRRSSDNTSPLAEFIPPAETTALDAGPAPRAPEELLATLESRLAENPSEWQEAVLETIGQWPLSSETVNGEQFNYLIGGEAFDWRLLARRILENLENGPRADEWRPWLDTPDLFAGFGEPEFMRMLGVDKFRASLSYFYGVTVEQGLIVATREEITKRRVASGRAPTDDRCEEADERLYGDDSRSLWHDYLRETNRDQRDREQRSLGQDDAFVYWLFKRRMERSDPARVASDTRKGLAQLERMLRSHERRQRMRRVRQT
jgi:hypothetical protein